MHERTARSIAPPLGDPGGDGWEGFRRRLGEARAVLFLDFDGTLAPIVERPADAAISDAMRRRIRSLARLIPVAVVSGRDLRDVRTRTGIDGLVYAGSHGFDIEGPGGLRMRHEGAEGLLPALDHAQASLEELLGRLDGVEIERKGFSLAVHVRRVSPPEVTRVEAAVKRTLDAHAGLRCTTGKCVFDLQPDLPWDKGRAMLWILDAVGVEARAPALLPIFVGDDVTDEDAFRALRVRGAGIGIAVQDIPAPTAAHFRVEDPEAVGRFLENLEAALPDEGVRAAAPGAV